MIRIKRTADQLHGLQVRFGEHLGHEHLLFLAYAMLSSDGAADPDAKLQNLARKLLCILLLSLDAAIVQNERVQVSISCVEDVGNAQSSQRRSGA